VRQCPFGLNKRTEPAMGEAVESDGADVGGPGNGVHGAPSGAHWAGPRRFTRTSSCAGEPIPLGPNRLESRMRENRTYGSEGGEAQAFPTPISFLRPGGRSQGRAVFEAGLDAHSGQVGRLGLSDFSRIVRVAARPIDTGTMPNRISRRLCRVEPTQVGEPRWQLER
jgi:hypothetical protein